MSKPKIIIFDFDGVLFRHPYSFIKELENKGYQNADKVMQPYYKEISAMTCGNEDCEDEEKVTEPYLLKLGWKGTVSEFLDEQAQFTKRYLDQNMISEIGNLRAQNIKCYLATNQGVYRTRFILEDLNFREIFDGHYISSEIGFRKNTDEFWRYALEDIEKETGISSAWEIIYFDDTQANIDVASRFGIQGFLFTDTIQFENDMNMLGFDVSLNKFF